MCEEKKKPFIREKERPWMLMFLCQGSTNCCLKNPFKLLELLFVVPWIVVNTFCAKKLHWWKRSLGKCYMKIKKFMVWTSHNNCTWELMSRNENSSLFKMLRFVSNLCIKLWVWCDQHICSTNEKVKVAINSYHMETKGQKNNDVLLNTWCWMSKLS